MSSGWLTTKKTADQIERDRQVALETRRQQRGLQPKKTSQKTKQKKRKGFIADDDDSSDNEEVEWDGDDEEELTDPGVPNDSDDDDSDVSSPGNNGFFGIYRKRTSKAPPKVQAIQKRLQLSGSGGASKNQNRKSRFSSSSSEDEQDAVGGRVNSKQKKPAAVARKRSTKPAATPKRSVAKRKSAAASSDDDDSILEVTTRKPARNPASVLETSPHDTPDAPIEVLSSSDDNDDARSKKRTASKSILAPASRRRFGDMMHSSEDDDDDFAATKQQKSQQDPPRRKSPPDAAVQRKRKTIVASDDDDDSDDEELLLQSQYFASKPAATASSPVAAQRDDDDGLLVDTPCKSAANPKKKKKKKKPKVVKDADVCSDDDEAVAIAAAMEESLRTAKMKEDDDDVVDLVDSDNDEREQDDYVGDDEDAQAASAVLATANQLSAHILQTMAQWSNVAVQGMIVDNGSLAMMEAAKDTTQDPNWISEETMRSILPASITLAEYQLVGVNWLALLHGMKCEVDGAKMTNVNGILADEMGLGKTCQTIAFLSWLKHRNTTEPSIAANQQQHLPHLIVAPSSVVSNWKREFETFAPQLNVVKYHGSQQERREFQLTIRELARTGSLDIVLAPITYFQKETSDDRAFLRKIQFDYLIVDEGHLLKNARGLRYKSMDRFQTLHRLLLTGTPVQNSPKELMALLSFLMPLFSTSDASGDDADDGAESMLQHFVSLEHNHDERAAYTKLKQLFSPFVLRRRKEDVLSQILPPKERQVELVEINQSARQVYDAVIAQHVESKQRGKSAAYEHLFTRLRKAAHHPLMLRTRYTSNVEKDHLAEHFYKFGAFQGEACTKQKVAEEIENFSDFEIHLTASELVDVNEHRRAHLDRYILCEDDLFSSAKFVRLRRLLPETIANKHRVLIFSQWTTCLDLLGCLLESMQIKYLRMDGSTQVAERQTLIDEFNEDNSISVFLLSTKACGQGINLTSADTCIMHDLDFNPFNDLQAEDRCHRIGQKKPVTIIKMVSKDTVDEEIYKMQQRKAKMNAAIMGNDADWKKSLQREKEIVLSNAVDRFLQSPTKKLSPAELLKENASADTNAGGQKFDSI